MKNCMITTLLFTLTLSTAMAKDVLGPKGITHGSSYVRVKQPVPGRVSFESCIAGYEKSTCAFLGSRKNYSVEKLESQKLIEDAQVVGSAAADIVIVVGAIFSGGYGGALVAEAFYGVGSVSTIGLLSGATGGAAASTATVVMVDALNPVEQYRQAQTISKGVVNDHQVKVGDIDDFIKRLDLVLSKL